MAIQLAIPLITSVVGLFTANTQAQAAKAASDAQQAEASMQLAAAEADREQRDEMFKNLLIYGGGGLGIILLLRTLKGG